MTVDDDAERPPRRPAQAETRLDLERTAASVPSAKRDLAFHGLPEGTIIDQHYRVERELGRGGMGVVLLARDLRLDRPVAIKLVRPALLDVPGGRERFLAEARAMARLQHAHVVGVYASGEHEGLPYIVMEYVPGQTLSAFLRARGNEPLGADEALGILDQVCRGVSAIHASGAVHRDIKPGNILVGPAFRLVLGDLGLARVLAELRGEGAAWVSGTPAYMAPEVLLGAPIDPDLAARSDVFSLGVIAYQLLTGVLPFGPDGPSRTSPAAASAIPRVSRLNPALPPAVDDVLIHALATFPENRTHGADAFRRALITATHDSQATGPVPARILVADDDQDYRDLIRMVMARAFPGSVVEGVPDGATALEVAGVHAPELAVIDLDMPGMNGVELTAALRAQPGTRDVPIIVASAIGGPTDWRLLSQLGADGFLGKPFEPAQLVALARSVLQGRRLARGKARGGGDGGGAL